MATLRGLVRRDGRGEAGFTIVESVIAAGILVIAIVLTVTPLVISMRALERSKDVTVSESLAQARLEQIRALEFGDIGHPGSAPSGIVDPIEVQTVGSVQYTIETTIEYVGSASGLDIIPQGGDGVEGAFDIGVNYKYITVSVAPVDGSADPVVMETFVAPPTVGGLENIAVVQVEVSRHEPFDPSLSPEPLIRLTGPSTYTSPDANTTQYFADVDAGTYTISLVTSDGWLIHPETIDSGATDVDAVLGINSQRTIRVYQPVSLQTIVLDDSTGLPITTAVVTATNQAYGPPLTNAAGNYDFAGLVPDRYAVEASASGYATGSVEIDVAGFGGGTSTVATIRLIPQAFVGVDYSFFVDYAGWSRYYISGASVTVTHPTEGTFFGTTDETGWVTIELPQNTSGFTVTASTVWGHGPVSQSFSTATSPGSRSLSLTKPGGTDRFALRNGGVGPAGFFEYKVGSGPWVRVPGNNLGRATFIVPEDKGTVVQLTTFCAVADYPGSPAATSSTTLNNKNKSWNAGASC